MKPIIIRFASSLVEVDDYTIGALEGKDLDLPIRTQPEKFHFTKVRALSDLDAGDHSISHRDLPDGRGQKSPFQAKAYSILFFPPGVN
jgi:hypothetical protein